MGYYSSLDIDLKSSCYELSAIQDALDKPSKKPIPTDQELIREALFTLINEREEIHANYEDLMVRIFQIDALNRKEQRRLWEEKSRYIQLSFFDFDIVNTRFSSGRSVKESM